MYEKKNLYRSAEEVNEINGEENRFIKKKKTYTNTHNHMQSLKKYFYFSYFSSSTQSYRIKFFLFLLYPLSSSLFDSVKEKKNKKWPYLIISFFSMTMMIISTVFSHTSHTNFFFYVHSFTAMKKERKTHKKSMIVLAAD